jgi:hypothetical protein
MESFKQHAIWNILVFSIFNGLFALTPAFAQADNSACGPLGNTFGPFDYRTERGEKLSMVEGAHFLPEQPPRTIGDDATRREGKYAQTQWFALLR